MFSRRLPWYASPNEFSTLLSRKRAEGAALFDLTQSNPTVAGIAYPETEILSALASPSVLRYQPDPKGLTAARTAIAAAHAVSPDQVVITASTSEAYSLLFKLLCDPGDAVLAPRPSYPLFDHLAALEGITLRPYDLVLDRRWEADLPFPPCDAKAVLCVNPNNPTGSYVRESDLDRVERLGLPLISDEVFHGFPFGEPGPRSRDRAGLTVFTLGGLSKSAGLPQVKLGWILATGPGWKSAVSALAAAADAYLSVSATAMHAAPRLLELAPSIATRIAARTRSNLDALRAAAGPRLLAPEGGWYAVLEAPAERTDESWALDLLATDGVVVHPGYFFGFPREAFLVVSLLAPEAEFDEGIRRVIARF